MNDLDAAGFDAYFRAVHDVEPYPWQSRLTRQVLTNERWPDVIDLPTGTGKTAVLDTAIYTLAVRPDLFPRRIVFVIDRRIVVDQVYERAARIRDRVRDARDGVAADLRERLSEVTDADEPLGIAALRGGIPIDGEWARRPEQPWVMVSTVDQFGSRLLFRGYGVSRRMRPVHAGLAGNDCLVILDEVHLSRPFADTLSDVSSTGDVPLIRAVNRELLPRRFQIVEMSATPANKKGQRFKLEQADTDASPRLKQIAEAPKRAKLVEIRGTRPAHESVPKKVLELIRKELRDDEMSVGVIVNRVRTARKTHEVLHDAGFAAHLVTGRMRPIDRKQVLDDISRCVDPDRSSAPEERTIVVATQAIEVGADFSFDALISEAAPVDSLRQRIGRLDRRGTLASRRSGAARCWVLGVSSALNPKRPDPVYGDAARITWEELHKLAEDDEIDVGPSAKTLDSPANAARAPQADAPLLLPTHIDAWAQTDPEPVVQPSIAEFLHGQKRRHEPDVSVVWRMDRSDQALTLVPPRPAEFLAVPISALRNWISGAGETPVADTDTALIAEEPKGAKQDHESADQRLSRVNRWTRSGDSQTEQLERVEEIDPGDVIVVHPDLGGLRHGSWDPGDSPKQEPDGAVDAQGYSPVKDIGDEAQHAYGTRATLRLDPRLFTEPQIPPPPLPSDERDTSMTRNEIVGQWLAETDALPPGVIPDWMAKVVGHFAGSRRFDIKLVQAEEGSEYYILVERSVDAASLDGFDDAPSLTGTEVTLRDHLLGVGAKAAEYGRRLGLSEALVEDLRLAGELHDLGKVDSRFQSQLHGHDPVRLAQSEEPLAKSLRGARTRHGAWPPVRHEISSVALVKSNPSVLERAHDRDLVLHLVGTHHGCGRPLPLIKTDDEPQVLEAAHDGLSMTVSSDLVEMSLALEMADRFWRLHERYGHHGVAWLEAILRLADHRRSEEETQ